MRGSARVRVSDEGKGSVVRGSVRVRVTRVRGQ